MTYSNKYGLVTDLGFKIKEYRFSENGSRYGQIFKNGIFYGSIDSLFKDKLVSLKEIISEHKNVDEQLIKLNYKKLQGVFNKF